MSQVPPRAPRSPSSSGTVSLLASLTLLIYAALGAFGLVAWLRAPHLWSWRVLVALVTCLAALGTSAAVWLAPSRRTAAAGLGVLLLSLARLGAPDTWSNASYGILAVTVACALPLVRACFALD